MAVVHETKLPGVGVRYDFTTGGGVAMGVLVHRTGRRDLLVYAPDDDSRCTSSIELEPDDSQTLAELLGASRISEQLAHVQQSVEGLAIDWLRVEDGAEWAGVTLADAAVHTNTGVSVVALIGPDGDAVAAPGATAVFEVGNVAVAVGTPDGLEELAARLRRPSTAPSAG